MSREVCGICWCPYDDITGECACPPPNVQKSTLREAATKALEALDWHSKHGANWASIDEATEALRAALAEPVQEPVAFKDAPKRIYLQVCSDEHCEVPFHEHVEEVSWCATKQHPLDVPYVRADLANPPQRPAEPVQEPFGYLWPTGGHPEFRYTQQKRGGVDGMPLYAAPPQRKPLTVEEILATVCLPRALNTAEAEWLHVARAIERAHGIGGKDE